jgi:predicted SnoaL-like aldol condensation-catalyzing enzyme
MKKSAALFCLAVLGALPFTALAQVRVDPQPNHEFLLSSPDPKLAANKKLVYDFWREVMEAGHVELAEKYLTDDYIQHNPGVATGRAAFMGFFSKFGKPRPIETRVRSPLIMILADGDFVVLSFVRILSDPKDLERKYTTTWFDMFRIENGKIAEHWDEAQKS